MTRLNWEKCRQRGRATESIYGSGVDLANGERTAIVVGDDLARRAKQEMRRWLRKLPRRQRNAVRFASHVPVSIGRRR